MGQENFEYENNVQSANNLQIVFYNDNIVKFKVTGEEVKTAFYNYENIFIRFYESSEQQKEDLKLPTLEFSQVRGNTGRGDVFATTYTREGNDSEGYMIYPHIMTDGVNEYNKCSAASDYGVAMKYECDGISDLIGNTSIYELYIGNELMCVGYSFARSELYEKPSKSHWYSYLGRFDNVKYFEEDIDAIDAIDASPIIVPITYSSDERWYKHQRDDSIFDNLQFKSKEIIQSTETIHADNTMTDAEADFEYKITTYSSSELAGSSINYEEEAAKYNTAPEKWQVHPYASFFPELPQGVTLKYVPDQTINEEKLSLYTGENGCTREQALEFIDELRNIEYEELRYEVKNDDEVQLVLMVEDRFLVGAYWRKDEQSMFVYAFKEQKLLLLP